MTATYTVRGYNKNPASAWSLCDSLNDVEVIVTADSEEEAIWLASSVVEREHFEVLKAIFENVRANKVCLGCRYFAMSSVSSLEELELLSIGNYIEGGK
jgi:hypothetical protein